MKKVSILSLGIVIGIASSISFSAAAESIQSLIGKQFDGQFPVTINGKVLDNQAGVSEGTSYLPVRAIGDALDLDVKFDAKTGIELSKKKEVAAPVNQSTETKYNSPADEAATIDGKLMGLQVEIHLLKADIDRYKLGRFDEDRAATFDEAATLKKIAELEQEQTRLQARLAEIEAK
jgi:hypothetical protein